MKMDDSEEEACLSAMQLATGSVLPMVLRSAIELNLFELINNSDRPNVSASEIAAKLSTTNPDAPDLLDRILRLLAVHSVLACSGGAAGERRYSLTPMGKFFTKDEDGISIAQLALFIQDEVMMKSWYSLKDAIMEGGTPFSRAHGMSIFDLTAMDDRMGNIFNQAMSHSTIHLKQLIHTYKGFEGINTLVDVGGGSGTALNMIVSKYPSIKGINFDLPHVVRDAPSFPGIEHVGGDMFVSVPKGDAIFMKWIIHDWSDESCLKILKNCKEALAENGKVIIADFVLSELPKNGPTAFGVEMDVMMLAFTQGGKERTKMEFQTLAKAAGFKEFRYVCSVFTMGVIELYK